MRAIELDVCPLEEDLWGVAGAADGADHKLIEDGQRDGCSCVRTEIEPTRVVIVGNDIRVWSHLHVWKAHVCIHCVIYV